MLAEGVVSWIKNSGYICAQNLIVPRTHGIPVCDKPPGALGKAALFLQVKVLP
ncbi:hypothetical protein RINTU1_20390 [Candidatus Regiella insecticola]|uniref:Uncharacterized protein n=1 Tax=Candidatus Regiella insecticola TaxID=138073 RepID=A0A6L2ZNR6_9ENTR|nr:hypothetical protein RINTU1_20390 [Candidatus Regiella insecticola]